MGKSQWRASSNGPDWTDLSILMWDFDHTENVNTALFIEPVMSRGGGSVYICVSVRDRNATVDPKPALALVQAYWPEQRGRTIEAFLYFLIIQAQETAAAKILKAGSAASG